MTGTVAVPLWLLILIVALAAISFLSHFLFPSVRWYFRRRMERVVGELNKRLDRPIQPFKLMERNDMIVRLVHDPKVAEAVVAEAAATGEPESVVQQRARSYAREIVPSFSASLYFGVATRLARWLARLVYRVRIGEFDAAAIEAIDRKATVVFVMNHRSNMDYVLVTYLAAGRTALSYAVGEWARVWPLSGLIRSMGAYFIRRKSNNPLYRRVLMRYVQMATEAGVTQAIFPEGGLSLDGRVGAARLGILSYIVTGYQPGERDVVFIPVAINYDRVLEDRVLNEAQRKGERRFRASVRTIAAFLGRHLWRKLRGRFKRFGYAAVSFGRPLSLSEVVAGARGDATEALAARLMDRIRSVVPVLPVPLAAIALGEDLEVPEEILIERARAFVAQFEAKGAHLNLPSGPPEARLRVGLETLAVRRIVSREAGMVRVNPKDRELLAFYAASVRQLLDAPAA
jgi:glycerol-3-phosphate O-acyltransferase